MKIVTTLLLSFFVLGLNAQFDILELSEARYNITSVKFDDKILFVGGGPSDNTVDYLSLPNHTLTSEEYSSDGFTGALDLSNERYAFFCDLSGVNTAIREWMLYDNSTGQWSEGKYDTANNVDHAYLLGNTAYLIDDRDSDNMFSFDLENQTWGTVALPFQQRKFTLLQDDNKIYFVGGELAGSKVSNIEVLDIATMTWTTQNLSSERRSANAILHMDYLIVHGGENDFSKEVEIINTLTFESKIVELEDRNNDAIMLANNSKLVLAGGESGDAIIIDLDSLEMETYQLEDIIRLPFLKGANLGAKMYFGGGLNDFSTVHIYNTVDGSWAKLNMGEGRQRIEMLTCGNNLYIAGGQTPSGETNELLLIHGGPVDIDGDGFSVDVDCDDDNPDVNPGASEEPYNGIDEDCDPATLDDDLDQDGFVLAVDCDDMDAGINPDAVDVPDNMIDEDCDGMDSTVSTHELGEAVLDIYPSPAVDMIYLDFKGTLNFKVTVYTMGGQLMFSSENPDRLDVSSYDQGTYLLEITEMNSGKRILDRIVVSK